jgi:DNA-directed RNA polymerase specialized sigma24 family protein
MAAPAFPSRSLTREAVFYTTRWSVVLTAREKSKGEAMESLETLCRQYWPPLYAYARQRGHAAPDAQDLTQAFFARLLEKEWLLAADREKGRFRSFLLMAMKRFLANDWDRSQTRKRGGGLEFISLEAGEAGHLCAADRMAAMPADSLFEKRWALTVLESVMRRLRLEHEETGRLEEYEKLKPWLTADRGSIPYDQLAAALTIAPASARSAMHRLRKRFRSVFREEVAGTVADPADVEDEMRAVVAALARD